MSEDELLNARIASGSLKKSKKSFDDPKPKLNFSKPKIEEIKKNLMNQGINFLNQK